MASPSRRRSRAPRALGEVELLIRTLERVRSQLLEVETRVPLGGFGTARESARNLLHYLALRRFDLRRVQDALADLGLSSLGRAEGHVLFNLEAILDQLYRCAGTHPPPLLPHPRALTPLEGRITLSRNADQLFGRASPGRPTRIMVTLPSEAGDDPGYLEGLLRAGADCVRINCAHDQEATWSAMISNLRRAEEAVGRRCRVEMDLGGPRLRTGPIRPGPAVLKVRPSRDAMGRSVGPGRLLIQSSPPAGHPTVETPSSPSVPRDWVERRHRGERVSVRDARGAERIGRVEAVRGGRAWVSLPKTTYLTNGLILEGRSIHGRRDRAVLDGILPRPGRIRLAPGDVIRLTPDSKPAPSVAQLDARRSPRPSIGLSEPGVLDRLRRGDRVWFDGGRIGGVVQALASRGAELFIDSAPPAGTWLRADQGINLPDTELELPSLSEQDLVDLRFIVRHADLVGYSFVQSPKDVELLRQHLSDLGNPRMGVILKIETRRAFEELPAILLGALRSGPTGVMVARGDLAVEVGFDRLAEVQEEILWLSEAAHLPAIWATQVLEGLAKSGIPSRAEVTDAAMGERAECVMLNKGPYLAQAVRALDSILRRMQTHQSKKSARLRHLRVAERFLGTPAGALPPKRAPGSGRGRSHRILATAV